jgi:hypothetical protein
MYDIQGQRARQELAHRTGGGIEVTLFWSAADDALTVRVVDHFVEETFEMPVTRDRGNFAFNHPFAYAAEQGLDRQAIALPAA